MEGLRSRREAYRPERSSASTVEAGLVLAEGDLGVASTRGGGFVLAGLFLAWRAPGEAFWGSRRLSVW